MRTALTLSRDSKQGVPATLHNTSKQEIQANLPYTTSAKQEVQAKPPAATEGRSVQRMQTGWQR